VVQLYVELERLTCHKVKAIGDLGAKVNQSYQPYTLTRNPPSISEVTLELLLASQAHLGHATSLWNPANARYIFGIRDGIHIISLEQTAAHLRRAAKVVQAVSERGGIILFAGTRKKQAPYVVKAATLAGGYHLYEKWIPGTLTNAFVILGKATLKVVDQLDRSLEGFEEQLFDRAPFKPDLVVCLNPRENYTMLHECAMNNIPTIGVIDTNSNPTWVTYPIPANDDRQVHPSFLSTKRPSNLV
jgi:small subunit ribosomal protein S2